MATQQLVIPAASLIPTGTCRLSRFADEMSLASANGAQLCLVMPDPNGAGDHGARGTLYVPANYVGSPVLRIIGVIDGTPANNLAFGIQTRPLDDSESFDQALLTEDTANNGTWTGYADEDVYEETITMTNGAPAAGDVVPFFFYIDDSQATPYTGAFLLSHLIFEYSDT